MGRDKKNERRHEHGTFIVRSVVMTPAFRELSPSAKALYVFLRLEWKGANANNNGKIFLSYRQAADRLGVARDTAGKAFQDLQAKGFIVVKDMACLGSSGDAKAPTYELTEISLPSPKGVAPRRLYNKWKPGQDFEVVKHSPNNPRGRNGRN